MKAQSATQDVIAANIARMSVPGNKRTLIAFELPPESGLQKGSDMIGTTRALGMKGSPLQARTVIDFSPGELEETKSPTDLGIQGNSFFKVQEPGSGGISYSRNGQFSITNEGNVVTSDGAQVLLADNTPFKMTPNQARNFNIDENGKITAPNAQGVRQTIGSLAFASMDDPRVLLSQGSYGRFQLADASKIDQVKEGLPKGDAVRQGFLEQSNASSVSEMVEMIKVVRTYDANKQVTTASDDITGDIIHAVNDVS